MEIKLRTNNSVPQSQSKLIENEKNLTEQMLKTDAFKELNDLIGLNSIKKLLFEIYAFSMIQRKRQQEGLLSDGMVLHALFKGNPGTGKTTVARLIGKIYKSIGILQRGHVVEIERADLVGEYIGHTAQKTRDQLKKASGGILFIDEAYSLARGGEKDFGREAIDTLVKGMEDYKDNLILILAGYKGEMEYFLQSNPGLRSRFPLQIDFPDYTTLELMEIAEYMLKKREYQLNPQAKSVLYNFLARSVMLGDSKEGNARLVRNIIEKSIRRQAVRLISKQTLTKQELMLLVAEDMEK